MRQTITVEISEDGSDVRIAVEGVKGRGCLAATLALERALGLSASGKGRKLTDEYLAVPAVNVESVKG